MAVDVKIYLDRLMHGRESTHGIQYSTVQKDRGQITRVARLPSPEVLLEQAVRRGPRTDEPRCPFVERRVRSL